MLGGIANMTTKFLPAGDDGHPHWNLAAAPGFMLKFVCPFGPVTINGIAVSSLNEATLLLTAEEILELEWTGSSSGCPFGAVASVAFDGSWGLAWLPIQTH